MVLLQIFLHVCILLLYKNNEFIFPTVSFINSNWFLLNCGVILPTMAVPPSWRSSECRRLGQGREEAPELEQRCSSTRCSPTTMCSPWSSFLPFLFFPCFFLLPFPVDMAKAQHPLRRCCCVSEGGGSWAGLHCHVHRQPKLVVCVHPTELRTWER